MFADLILPLSLQHTLTYSIPEELSGRISTGICVVVEVKRKMYSGIVQKIYESSEKNYKIKPILYIVDENPIVNKNQIDFWEWISKYYMCSIGEVMRAALPSCLKLESETTVSATNEKNTELEQPEYKLLKTISENKTIKLQKLYEISGKKNIIPMLQKLADKKVIYVDEKIKNTYKPKQETLVSLNKSIKTENDLNKIIDSLKRAKQQEKLLLFYLSLYDEINFSDPIKISKTKLINKSGVGATTLNACIGKKIFETTVNEITRIETAKVKRQEINKLSAIQQKAFDKINLLFETKNTVLLYGITSSGKTEIYLNLISKQIKLGKQVLYLLPEIALTTQIVERIRSVFGDIVCVYHSKLNNLERAEIYKNLSNRNSEKKYSIIIGARSALFLPLQNLGLIIVDEEHETAYKQNNPAPRYNARDAAIVLAGIHKAKTILGSATPSIESFFNAKTGKYGLANINERFGNVSPPKFETTSILRNFAKKQMNGHFTKELLDAIYVALQNNEQIILFQNRRGFATYVQCQSCGYTPTCKRCNVSLTYHSKTNNLRCHYCGYSTPMILKCDNCGSKDISKKGFGTEKIEEELSKIFPKAHIARFDLDTTRKRKAFDKIISEFDLGEIDILIGTQMVSKGLDFDNVGVVGILNADNLLNFPEFRSHERAFQLITQTGGRAGRRNKTGKVIVQTYNPENNVIRDVVDNDYRRFYERELSEREQFLYPPFVRLIEISVKHRNYEIVNKSALKLVKMLNLHFGDMVLGPEIPLINRIKNMYINNVLLKLYRNKPVSNIKNIVLDCINHIKADSKYKAVSFSIDVDP